MLLNPNLNLVTVLICCPWSQDCMGIIVRSGKYHQSAGPSGGGKSLMGSDSSLACCGVSNIYITLQKDNYLH